MSGDLADTFHEVVPPRPFNEWEREAVALMLDAGDAGDAARAQLASARVIAQCTHCPTVTLRTDAGLPLMRRRPGTAAGGGFFALHGTDADGMFVEMVLVAQGGRFTAIDVWRGDGAVLAPPALSTFTRAVGSSWDSPDVEVRHGKPGDTD